jgi:hypothetical protein
MALKATIFKAGLQIADLDRHYYGDHALTLARHPSETDERMMVRLLAFALHADAAQPGPLRPFQRTGVTARPTRCQHGPGRQSRITQAAHPRRHTVAA